MSDKSQTPAVDRQVVAELVARAQAGGMAVDGEDGLLAQLTKLVLESSLQVSWMLTWVMPSMIRPGGTVETPATARGSRPC